MLTIWKLSVGGLLWICQSNDHSTFREQCFWWRTSDRDRTSGCLYLYFEKWTWNRSYNHACLADFVLDWSHGVKNLVLIMKISAFKDVTYVHICLRVGLMLILPSVAYLPPCICVCIRKYLCSIPVPYTVEFALHSSCSNKTFFTTSYNYSRPGTIKNIYSINSCLIPYMYIVVLLPSMRYIHLGLTEHCQDLHS